MLFFCSLNTKMFFFILRSTVPRVFSPVSSLIHAYLIVLEVVRLTGTLKPHESVFLMSEETGMPGENPPGG